MGEFGELVRSKQTDINARTQKEAQLAAERKAQADVRISKLQGALGTLSAHLSSERTPQDRALVVVRRLTRWDCRLIGPDKTNISLYEKFIFNGWTLKHTQHSGTEGALLTPDSKLISYRTEGNTFSPKRKPHEVEIHPNNGDLYYGRGVKSHEKPKDMSITNEDVESVSDLNSGHTTDRFTDVVPYLRRIIFPTCAIQEAEDLIADFVIRQNINPAIFD